MSDNIGTCGVCGQVCSNRVKQTKPVESVWMCSPCWVKHCTVGTESQRATDLATLRARLAEVERERDEAIDKFESITGALGLHPDTEVEQVVVLIEAVRSEARNYPHLQLQRDAARADATLMAEECRALRRRHAAVVANNRAFAAEEVEATEREILAAARAHDSARAAVDAAGCLERYKERTP